jgi:hypothetical protein
MSDIMTLAEAQYLDRCEAVITRGMKTFIEVGNALSEIRDERLYRASHGTFDEYCRDRWGWTSSRARQLIGAAETVTNVTAIGGTAPGTESQARELAGLTADQAATVMRVAHERSGGNITAAAIRESRQQPWTDAEIKTAIDGYRIHPFAAMYPAFKPQEWERLAPSVGRRLLKPILLTPDGTAILDGRFRYLALKWNGIDPETAQTDTGKPALQRLTLPDPLPAHCEDEDEFMGAVVYALNCLRKSYTEDEIAAAEAAIRTAKAVAR